MIVRCGRCRTQFEVPGPGRFSCPACGSANQVGGAPPEPGIVAPPSPAPEPDRPSPRVSCPECGFEFIVGDIATAPCPMCGAAVAVEAEPPSTAAGDEVEET
jgi:DNA-directed RNA polymerase subunit RPC12/RpoP